MNAFNNKRGFTELDLYDPKMRNNVKAISSIVKQFRLGSPYFKYCVDSRDTITVLPYTTFSTLGDNNIICPGFDSLSSLTLSTMPIRFKENGEDISVNIAYNLLGNLSYSSDIVSMTGGYDMVVTVGLFTANYKGQYVTLSTKTRLGCVLRNDAQMGITTINSVMQSDNKSITNGFGFNKRETENMTHKDRMVLVNLANKVASGSNIDMRIIKIMLYIIYCQCGYSLDINARSSKVSTQDYTLANVVRLASSNDSIVYSEEDSNSRYNVFLTLMCLEYPATRMLDDDDRIFKASEWIIPAEGETIALIGGSAPIYIPGNYKFSSMELSRYLHTYIVSIDCIGRLDMLWAKAASMCGGTCVPNVSMNSGLGIRDLVINSYQKTLQIPTHIRMISNSKVTAISFQYACQVNMMIQDLSASVKNRGHDTGNLGSLSYLLVGNEKIRSPIYTSYSRAYFGQSSLLMLMSDPLYSSNLGYRDTQSPFVNYWTVVQRAYCLENGEVDRLVRSEYMTEHKMNGLNKEIKRKVSGLLCSLGVKSNVNNTKVGDARGRLKIVDQRGLDTLQSSCSIGEITIDYCCSYEKQTKPFSFVLPDMEDDELPSEVVLCSRDSDDDSMDDDISDCFSDSNSVADDGDERTADTSIASDDIKNTISKLISCDDRQSLLRVFLLLETLISDKLVDTKVGSNYDKYEWLDGMLDIHSTADMVAYTRTAKPKGLLSWCNFMKFDSEHVPAKIDIYSTGVVEDEILSIVNMANIAADSFRDKLILHRDSIAKSKLRVQLDREAEMKKLVVNNNTFSKMIVGFDIHAPYTISDQASRMRAEDKTFVMDKKEHWEEGYVTPDEHQVGDDNIVSEESAISGVTLDVSLAPPSSLMIVSGDFDLNQAFGGLTLLEGKVPVGLSSSDTRKFEVSEAVLKDMVNIDTSGMHETLMLWCKYRRVEYGLAKLKAKNKAKERNSFSNTDVEVLKTIERMDMYIALCNYTKQGNKMANMVVEHIGKKELIERNYRPIMLYMLLFSNWTSSSNSIMFHPLYERTARYILGNLMHINEVDKNASKQLFAPKFSAIANSMVSHDIEHFVFDWDGIRNRANNKTDCDLIKRIIMRLIKISGTTLLFTNLDTAYSGPGFSNKELSWFKKIAAHLR